jgi:hypothetical protein
MPKSYGRALLLRIGIIAVSVVLSAVAIVLFSGRLSAESLLISQARSSGQQGARSSEELAILKVGQQQAESILTSMNRFLPNEYELFKFNDWADRTGRTQGVVVTPSIQIGSLFLLNDPLGYAPIGLAVSGAQNAVFSYLKFVVGNNGQYLIVLDSVDVSNTQNSSGTIVVNAQGKLLFKKQ